MTFLLHILHFRDDLSGMSTRIEMIGVEARFQFATLLSTVSGENVFIVFEIVMVVFVEMCFRHFLLQLIGLHLKWNFVENAFGIALSLASLCLPIQLAFSCYLASLYI